MIRTDDERHGSFCVEKLTRLPLVWQPAFWPKLVGAAELTGRSSYCIESSSHVRPRRNGDAVDIVATVGDDALVLIWDRGLKLR